MNVENLDFSCVHLDKKNSSSNYIMICQLRLELRMPPAARAEDRKVRPWRRVRVSLTVNGSVALINAAFDILSYLLHSEKEKKSEKQGTAWSSILFYSIIISCSPQVVSQCHTLCYFQLGVHISKVQRYFTYLICCNFDCEVDGIIIRRSKS